MNTWAELFLTLIASTTHCPRIWGLPPSLSSQCNKPRGQNSPMHCLQLPIVQDIYPPTLAFEAVTCAPGEEIDRKRGVQPILAQILGPNLLHLQSPSSVARQFETRRWQRGMTRTSRLAKTEEVSFTPSSPTPVTATGICNSKQPQQKNGNTGKAWTGLSSVFRKVARPYLDFSISLDFFVVVCILTKFLCKEYNV